MIISELITSNVLFALLGTYVFGTCVYMFIECRKTSKRKILEEVHKLFQEKQCMIDDLETKIERVSRANPRSGHANR